ncbi:HupE/UreJ family protein [Rhodovastum atsumiense]|uniref:HupE/UreJ family protein n=1 Tax=Rhodovastum atsumiense TaxID=504468 RepID=A0A5M6IM76_9PROT|nr:HupE/UreJ family protein [Rhodovastum atsumiense]KAA5609393.1 HupE/UreJ family protein [Rhodovastum atsumiense]CAH2601852.1 HupE/UreJ family protein [Rhodovastum atsumiense]
MSCFRSLRDLRLLLAVILALLALPATAHEASMGVYELRELQPNTYMGSWVQTPNDMATRMRPTFPPQCHFNDPILECTAPGLVGPVTLDNLGFNMSAVMFRIVPRAGPEQSYTLTAGNPSVTVLGNEAPGLHVWINLASTYISLGIDHILLGIDHLLFVLGLMWLVPGGWRLAKTITAFTVGHSISLAAATFGLIGVPEKPLNAVIALSIAFVGVEIVRLYRGEPGLTVRCPWAVSLGFGIVHGIGFAGALITLGIQRNLMPAALLGFNIGVEIGQLAFVLLVLGLFWAHRTLTAILPRRADALPGYAIGVVAMFWFIGRMAILVTS